MDNRIFKEKINIKGVEFYVKTAVFEIAAAVLMFLICGNLTHEIFLDRKTGIKKTSLK